MKPTSASFDIPEALYLNVSMSWTDQINKTCDPASLLNSYEMNYSHTNSPRRMTKKKFLMLPDLQLSPCLIQKI